MAFTEEALAGLLEQTAELSQAERGISSFTQSAIDEAINDKGFINPSMISADHSAIEPLFDESVLQMPFDDRVVGPLDERIQTDLQTQEPLSVLRKYKNEVQEVLNDEWNSKFKNQMDEAMGKIKKIQPREERTPLSERVDRRVAQLTQEQKASDEAFELEMKRQRNRMRRMRRFNREQSGEAEREFQDLRRRRQERNERVRKANEYKLRQKRIAIRKAYVEKALQNLFRLSPAIVGGAVGSSVLAMLVKEFSDWIMEGDELQFRNRTKAHEMAQKLEDDLAGTNIGTMNPEVRANRKTFGTEGLFESSQGDMYYDDEQNIIIVSYRGTDFSRLFTGRPDLAIVDIINDLNMGVADYNGLKVHQGFLNMFLESLPEVQEFIDENMDEDTIVYTTGHSAGSPSAVLLAYLINQHRGNQHAICYTFGSPRFVIEGASAQLLDKTVPHHYRVNTDTDIIPYLPPRIVPNVIPQYIHIGTEYVFNDDEKGGYGIRKEDTRTTRSLAELGILIAGLLAKVVLRNNLIMPDGTSLASRISNIARPDTLTMGVLNEISDGYYRLFNFLYPSHLMGIDGVSATFNRKVQEIKQRFLYDFPQAKNIIDSIPNPATLRAYWDVDGWVDANQYEYEGNRYSVPLNLFRATSRDQFQEILRQKQDELNPFDAGLTGASLGGDPNNVVGLLRLRSLGIPVDRYKKYLNGLKQIFSGANLQQEFVSDAQFVVRNNRHDGYKSFMKLIFRTDRATNFMLALFPSFSFIQEILLQGAGMYLAIDTLRSMYGLVTGQTSRFLGHRTSVYDRVLSAFTDNKADLGHSVRPESEILGDNDCSTADGVFTKTAEEHFGRPVYESDGMRFTPHAHQGDLYMNHLPNLQDAIMGYYLYKPDEFKNRTGAIKGFVVF